MEINVNVNDPRQHVNEEPSNDFLDVGIGFIGMTVFMLVVATAATLISYAIQ